MTQYWCIYASPGLIDAEWCIYASVDETIIGSDKDLSPIRRQAIIWTSDVILTISP